MAQIFTKAEKEEEGNRADWEIERKGQGVGLEPNHINDHIKCKW